jgi:hypothetical protein
MQNLLRPSFFLLVELGKVGMQYPKEFNNSEQNAYQRTTYEI